MAHDAKADTSIAELYRLQKLYDVSNISPDSMEVVGDRTGPQEFARDRTLPKFAPASVDEIIQNHLNRSKGIR